MIISVYSIDRFNDVVDCIESIKSQTFQPKEIVLVLDPEPKLVEYYKKRLGTKIKIVVSDSFGLSAARNTGIKNTSSEFVAFIDDDAVANRDWLKNLVDNFNNSTIIGVGGNIIPIWPSKTPAWFPEELYWVVGCSYKGLPTKKVAIRNPIGCNMAFRRNVFKKTGLFSTDTGRIGNELMGHDDTEFGIRAINKLSGKKIIYAPEAIVYHKVAVNRVSLKYVVKRSYSEGFSKAYIPHFYSSKTFNVEKSYIRTLIFAIPVLCFQHNKSSISRFLVLSVAALMVFLGFIVGSLSK